MPVSESLDYHEDLWVRGGISSPALRGAAELHEQGASDHRAQAECFIGGSHRQWQNAESAVLGVVMAEKAEE